MEDLTIEKVCNVINVIRILRDEIYEQNYDEYLDFHMMSDGNIIIIDFLGITIWNSEDDEREYEDNGLDIIYEPLETYLRRRINEEIQKLSKIKL